MSRCWRRWPSSRPAGSRAKWLIRACSTGAVWVLPGTLPQPARPRPIIAFEIRGDSKVRPRTLGYLSHTAIGELITSGDLPRIQQALVSSGLFETVEVGLEPAPGDPSPGVIVAVTATDKHS